MDIGEMTTVKWRIVKDGIRQNQGKLERKITMQPGHTMDFDVLKQILYKLYEANSCLREYPLDAYGHARDYEHEPGLRVLLDFSQGVVACHCSLKAYKE